METDGFITNLLLSKASVGFVEPESVEAKRVTTKASTREQYRRLSRRAYLCRTSKKSKALCARWRKS